MIRLTATGAVLLAIVGSPLLAQAKPFAPTVFCELYEGELTCANTAPTCTQCHTSTNPPKLNAYGDDVYAAMTNYVSPPFDANTNAAFQDNLPQVLRDVEDLDSDGDGYTNLEEIAEATNPGDATSLPVLGECPDDIAGLDYAICEYDYLYVFNKIGVDFCGLPPTYDEKQSFAVMSEADQLVMLHEALDTCLDSEFWIGPAGMLRDIAHKKIRPVTGLNGFAQFTMDYDYFIYTQTDDRDVRDVLVGQYLVERTEDGDGNSQYKTVADRADQPMQPERRAGLLTTAWPLFYNTMFTALPRGTAAQAYRAFLGLDIAQSQGLYPVAGQPIDYDATGVTASTCAACHSTLDPLAQPFATYNGLQSSQAASFYMYDPDRIDKFFAGQFPEMTAMPESGAIFGQPVNDLLEWAQVAANSEQFFQATTKDYYKFLIGEDPNPGKADMYDDYTALWTGLADHKSVEQMLHAFIETEAYGAP